MATTVTLEIGMFRRKEESFEFESENGIENAPILAAASEGGSASPETAESRQASAAAPAPRPASLAQAPGAAPRQPAAAPAPSSFRPATPQAAPANSTPVASAPLPTPPAAARPAAPSAAPSAGGLAGAASGSSTSNSKTGGKRILTVGNDILLKGEIATCDRLVIEGEVDAKLNDVHTVEIAETGSFRGKAEIEDAEISGVFEGDLVVRNRLTIYSTGKVRGNITFGEIEIERGGELTGTISIVGQASKSKEKAA